MGLWKKIHSQIIWVSKQLVAKLIGLPNLLNSHRPYELVPPIFFLAFQGKSQMCYLQIYYCLTLIGCQINWLSNQL